MWCGYRRAGGLCRTQRGDPAPEWNRDGDGAPAPAVRFFEDTDYLLTHAAVLGVTVER